MSEKVCVYLEKVLVNTHLKTLKAIFFQFSEEALEKLWSEIPQFTHPPKFSVNMTSR